MSISTVATRPPPPRSGTWAYNLDRLTPSSFAIEVTVVSGARSSARP
nr:hypothetical protein [Frankia sp. R43]